MTDSHDARHLQQLLCEVVADLLGVLGPLASLQLTQNCQGSGASHGVTSIGGTMGAGAESGSSLVVAGDAADGEAAAHCLSHGHDVGLHAIGHVGHELAAAAPASLHFVQAEQDALLVAELTDALDELVGSGPNAALALNRLEHDSAGLALNISVLESLQVVELSIGEAGGQVAEALLDSGVGLAGSGHGAEGTAVEGLLSSDDVPSVGADVLDAPLTSHLDHSFVGLSTGVLIQNLVHADGLADFLGQDSLRNGVGIVEGLHDGSSLLLDGLHDLGVAVAQTVNGDTCIEVQIGLVVLIIHIDALGAVSDEVHTLIGLDHVLLDECLQFSSGQASVFQSHKDFLPFKINSDSGIVWVRVSDPVFSTAGYSFRLF